MISAILHTADNPHDHETPKPFPSLPEPKTIIATKMKVQNHAVRHMCERSKPNIQTHACIQFFSHHVASSFRAGH